MNEKPFQFDPELSLQENVRDVARLQFDAARAKLASITHPSDEGVHEFRKSVKRLRALARLVRPALGTRYKPLNSALRVAGRALSEVRDRQALGEVVSYLKDGVEDARVLEALEETQRRLENFDPASSPSSEASMEQRVVRALGSIDEAKAAFDRLELDSWSTLETGLAKVYRQARVRHRRAQGREFGRLHDLRKRIKDHRYQLRLLRAYYPRVLNAERHVAKEVSDLLGRDHDLAQLDAMLQTLGLSAASTHLLRGSIADRRRVLQDRAMYLCDRLLQEKPKRRAGRLIGYV